MKKIKLRNINKFLYIDDKDYIKIYKYKWRYVKNGNILTNVIKNTDNKNLINYTSLSLCGFLFSENKNRHKFFKDSNPLNFCRDNIIFYDDINKQIKKKLYNFNRILKEKESIRFSRYRGVSKRKNGLKYEAKINYKRNQIYLGTFDSNIEAAKAYDKKAIELLGNKAITNFK